MIETDMDDMLSLLAIIIFADKRILRSEIDTFMCAAEKLQIIREQDKKISEPRLLAWYYTHKDHLIELMNSTGFEDWFLAALSKVTRSSDRHAMLSVMGQIAMADHDVHDDERSLIMLSAHHWGIYLDA